MTSQQTVVASDFVSSILKDTTAYEALLEKLKQLSEDQLAALLEKVDFKNLPVLGTTPVS